MDPPALTTAVPCKGELTTLTVAGSSWRRKSVSLANTSIVTGVLASVSIQSSLATGPGRGGWFTARCNPLGTVRSSSDSMDGRERRRVIGFGRRRKEEKND